MDKRFRVMCALAAVLLLLVCTACASKDADSSVTGTTSATQNKAMENVPGKNTGDGQDKTDNPAATPSDSTNEKPLEKAKRDESKALFSVPSNIPPLSADGIKYMLKEAYYTVDGGLAVTLNLSNGTTAEQRVLSVTLRVANEKDMAITIPVSAEPKDCRVTAGGYAELYVLFEASSVLSPNDPLTMPLVTAAFECEATDSSLVTAPNTNPAVGAKDPAVGMSYYENYKNLPELSVTEVKASLVRARYTNDGSLAVVLMLSNGTTADQTVSGLTVTVQNADSGVIIASQTVVFEQSGCTVTAGGYKECAVMLDQSCVPMKYDPLSQVSATVTLTVA